MTGESTPNLSACIDESARRRFEADWQARSPKALQDYLPAPENPGFLGTLEELVHIDMEMRWKGEADFPPCPLEDYLARFPALDEPAIVARLVRHEIDVRQAKGVEPDLAGYQARFPNLAAAQLATLPVQTAATGQTAAPDGYEILGVLGRGGMGVVYKARQIRLNRIVALKRIIAGAEASGDDLARFRAEAAAIARLQHPNIVQIYEVGEADGRPFIALEYVDGGTLAALLKGLPQAPEFAARTLATLARAMQAVHQRGILHRDLKPANVLLCNEDGGNHSDPDTHATNPRTTTNLSTFTLKISDFGLAKRVEGVGASLAGALTETGDIVGTPAYMAPEQAAGDPSAVTQSADIYALGAMLFEMLTGRPPFLAATPLETVYQVLYEEPVTPRRLQPRIPRDLDTICQKCLNKDPGRRYASAQALAEDLERYLAGEPIRARPVGQAERAWRWCRRKPALASLAGGLTVMLAAAIIGVFLWQQAENARAREAHDFQMSQEQDRLRHLAEVRAGVDVNRRLGLADLKINRFNTADTFLRQALEVLKEEDLPDLREPVQQEYDRVHRVVGFYAQADKAERAAFVEQDDQAKYLCAKGLSALGVLGGDNDWWRRLPVADLTPEQADKLAKDAYHQLQLLASLRIKEAMTDADPKGAAQGYRDVLQIIDRVHAFHKRQGWADSLSARLLEAFCHFNLGQLDKIRLADGLEPTTASDCYFVGIACEWMAANPKDTTTQALQLGYALLGADVGNAAATSQRLLRKAAADNPRHFWTHFWLGWSLLSANDSAGAELAFTTCLTLRPDYALAYAERGRALTNQWLDKQSPMFNEDLRKRSLADLERASRFGAADYSVHLVLFKVYGDLGMKPRSLEAARRTLELLPPADLRKQRRDQEDLHAVRTYLKTALSNMAKSDPENFDLRGAIALAELGLGDDKEALASATRALEVPTSDLKADDIVASAYAVRGTVRLRQKKHMEALADFEASLGKRRLDYLAASGKARAQESLDHHEAALEGWDFLARTTLVDWQRLELHLARARLLIRLGRGEEARAALASARDIDLRVADSLIQQSP